MNKNRNFIKNGGLLLASGSLVVALIAGCGGGGGGGAAAGSTSTLTGVVAVGSPIVGGTVTVKCASGSSLTAITNYAGAYSVSLSGQTLPCAAELSGGTINGATNTISYHSIATAQGTMNVTPLTDLMVANLTGNATPSTWFTTPTGLSAFTPAQVSKVLSNTVTALGITTQLGTINPITTTFSAVNGGVMDDLLISLKTSLASGGGAITYTALLANAAATSFTAPSFSTPVAIAYMLTVSGGATAPVGTAGTPITTTYRDFNYLQNVNGIPSSSATIADNGTGTGTQTNNLVFGPGPTTSSFGFSNGGANYSWGSPLSYGNGFNSSSTDGNVPAVAMLCESGVANTYALGKSYDVLVANNATAITSAAQLAGLSFATYYEDCGTSTTTNGLSASIDASGNATFKVWNGAVMTTISLTASQFTSALTGTPNTGQGGFTTFNAYSYITALGATKYVLVEHGGNTATTPTSGYVGIWLQ